MIEDHVGPYQKKVCTKKVATFRVMGLFLTRLGLFYDKYWKIHKNLVFAINSTFNSLNCSEWLYLLIDISYGMINYVETKILHKKALKSWLVCVISKLKSWKKLFFGITQRFILSWMHSKIALIIQL